MEFIYDTCTFSSQVEDQVLAHTIHYGRLKLLRAMIKKGLKPEAGHEYLMDLKANKNSAAIETILSDHPAKLSIR